VSGIPVVPIVRKNENAPQSGLCREEEPPFRELTVHASGLHQGLSIVTIAARQRTVESRAKLAGDFNRSRKGFLFICDLVHRSKPKRRLNRSCNLAKERQVRPMGSVSENVDEATLRSRYAELLRLRGYVERLERLCQDDAEGRTRGWLAALNERCEGED
jgi:hypothetical protein